MLAIYSFFYFFYTLSASIAGFFDRKIRDGIRGRKTQVEQIRAYYSSIGNERYRILFHVASFGELEQAKPVIAELRKQYPTIHIHVTFFSPSGYINAKEKYTEPDTVSYLPFDDSRSVNSFLDDAMPDCVVFVRYDIWPRFTLTLQRRKIPAILISATYRSSFAKQLPIIRSFYRSLYHSLRHIFVITGDIKSALVDDGYSADAITVAGDTRIDQVLHRKVLSLARGNILPETIRTKLAKEKPHVLVVGSSWEEDEKVLCNGILSQENLFTIIAPHEITETHLSSLERLLDGKAVRLSRINEFTRHHILIWDTIGDLFDLYAYADIAYVGGGFGGGVHNVLEPAVRSIPIIVGPNHIRSVEIGMMRSRNGVVVVSNADEFSARLRALATDTVLRQETGKNAHNYLEEQRGASQAILHYLQSIIPR